LDNNAAAPFRFPAPFGGYFASRPGSDEPLTIDHYTAEGQLASLFGAGAHENALSARVWYSMFREWKHVGSEKVVASFPGAAFTGLFATGFLPRDLGPDRAPEWNAAMAAVDWQANLAGTLRCHQTLSPPGSLLLPDAVELPDATYQAQGRPELAVDAKADFKGTIALYSLEMAAGIGGDEAEQAFTEIRRLLREESGIWHPLWGLADAYAPDLSKFPDKANLLRKHGRWVQNQKFPLNSGAGLIGLLNYLTDGGVARRASNHPVINRGLERIFREPGPLKR
ncbi:MAG: hypothetical protein ABL994_06435, partial [Verrucomicrobiales bacterium]